MSESPFADLRDDNPSRRNYSRRREEEEPAIDRDEVSFRCPFCRARARPEIRSQVATGGWVLMVILMIVTLGMTVMGIFFFPCFLSIFLLPVCLIGLMVREQYRNCSSCGIRIG